MRPTIIMFICVAVFAILHGVFAGIARWHIKQQMAMLQLADDASTPELKAKYLGEFITRIETMKLPEHGAFVFKTDRNKISNQVEVLQSLQKRCQDLINVDVSSLGYAQGIQQITGQEFDHATSQIYSIISQAMWVQRGWFLAYGQWILWPITLIGVQSLKMTKKLKDGFRLYR